MSRLGRELLKLRGAGAPLHMSGLTPSARAYLCAALLKETASQNENQNFLVVCGNSDQATAMHQAVKFFLRLLDAERLSMGVGYFPGWELSPYRGVNPNVKTRLRRIRELIKVSRGETRLLITDARALAQKTPSPQSLLSGVFTVEALATLERETLRSKMESIGYQMTDPVEDPGSYCFRGHIMDLYSPYNALPARVEFLGDEIENIRFFNPETQRTKPDLLESVLIAPACEWRCDAGARESARSKIKAFGDEFDIPKRTRDELVEKISSGVRDPSFDYLLPFFESQPLASLSDYFPDKTLWSAVISDHISVTGELDRAKEDLVSGFKQAVESHQIAARPEDLYAFDILDRLNTAQSGLFLDPFQIGVVKSHEDLNPTPEDVPSESPASFTLTAHSIIPVRENSDLHAQFDRFVEKNSSWRERGYARAVVASGKTQAERIRFLLEQKNVPAKVVGVFRFDDLDFVQIIEGNLASGFRLAFDSLAVVTDGELFGPKKQRASPSKPKQGPSDALKTFIPSLEEIHPGELLVHEHHGIGRYQGLVKLDIDKIPQDFLLVEYAGADKLYVPIYRLDAVQRYIAEGEGQSAQIDRLGSNHFEKAKQKVREALKELAHDLLQIYAMRASSHGFSFSPPDEAYREFEAKFPFAETPDQLKAIDDTLSDMQSGKVMDRLICGDVGYGKTEVAMRAAYKAVLDGKQAAVLVPTTVLAMQHERSFQERFKDAGVKIASVSRFRSSKEVKETLAALREGKVDILIGTHRLLSRDVAFKDLGLIVVDEEQRFGVEHKERLKKLKATTAVLTLTATPIPRTLHLSLMGIRDISVINTAPIDRLSVRTYISKFDEAAIRSAITQEIARGGQVFFIYNRVQSIGAMAERLKTIVPNARITVAHGQLPEGALEDRMLEFYSKKSDILLCTTIIESGLDIPSANTMIINRADTFGLAQLYQLRGRVGRSQMRAYCYLLLPEEGLVTDEAKRRLEVIQRFVDLGSGFKIASHDLELRGGGDILGKAQSGHIATVGYELYTELLEEAIGELRGGAQKSADHFEPEIKIPAPALLPDDYVPDIQQRLGLYKRISQADTIEKVEDLEAELTDRFGKPPEAVMNLLELIQIKQLLVKHRIKTLLVGRDRISLEVASQSDLSPEKVLSAVKKNPGEIAVTPESKIILKKSFENIKKLHDDVRRAFEALV